MESRKSGKTHNHVQVRKMYVVYDVNGQQIIMSATEGVSYPKVAILYKN
jgi:hypothetical protein